VSGDTFAQPRRGIGMWWPESRSSVHTKDCTVCGSQTSESTIVRFSREMASFASTSGCQAPQQIQKRSLRVFASREVTLLDYGAGNVRSVRNAIKKLGYTIKDVGGGHSECLFQQNELGSAAHDTVQLSCVRAGILGCCRWSCDVARVRCHPAAGREAS
jgi:hypothetical protein